MKSRIWPIISLYMCIYYLTLAAAYAQPLSEPSFSIRCKNTPRLANMYKKALQDKLLRSIDPTQYADAQVVINMKRLTLETQDVVQTASTLTSGITVTFEGQPEGLAMVASGEMEFLAICTYTYQVITRARAVSTATNTRVRATTTSIITLKEPMLGGYKKLTGIVN